MHRRGAGPGNEGEGALVRTGKHGYESGRRRERAGIVREAHFRVASPEQSPRCPPGAGDLTALPARARNPQWIPASAGMTGRITHAYPEPAVDSRFRGNDEAHYPHVPGTRGGFPLSRE